MNGSCDFGWVGVDGDGNAEVKVGDGVADGDVYGG